MSLSLADLDESTRAFMLEEVNHDVDNARLYISGRLSRTGQKDYPDLLRQAVSYHNETWLSNELRRGRMNLQEERRKPTGGTSLVKVPITAPDTLAEGEFNRFYIRGLCRRAQEEGTSELVVYRAKQVENPRSESERKIGSRVSVGRLLNDLRSNVGIDTVLELPAGPNSGLSVKLP